MKKFLLICTIILVSFSLSAQNGGQANENPSVKMEFVSVINGVTTLKITNKQNCTAEIQTKSGSNERIKSYAPLTSDTVKFVGLTGTNVKIQSKPLTNCGTTDYGQVELFLNIDLLPVKFVSVKSRQIDDTTIQVDFQIAELTNVSHFNIKLSVDGKSWKTVAVVFPDNVQPNRVYSAKISLK